MEERLQHSDILHNITVDVFQRTIDLGPHLREFVTSAKQYHRALVGASVAANSFYQGFAKIAHLASETKGSNKLLSKGICDLIAVHKQIESQAGNVLKAISQEFIIPLEDWIENNVSQAKAKQKAYGQDSKIALELVDKSRSDLTKVRKKSQRSKTSDKYELKEHQIMAAQEQYQAKLNDLRVSGCHEALRTQRNVFSFIVEKMSAVSKINVNFHEKAYKLLNSRLPIWENLVRQPLSLDVDVSSLVKQLTENGVYDKSLDEHLFEKVQLGSLTPPPANSSKLADKRFSVGAALTRPDEPVDQQTRAKVRALYVHEAADSTQLCFEKDDIIKTLTDVTSGWQYGENTRTRKSGWFPVAFTEKVPEILASNHTNQTRTLPSSGPVHPRLSVLPSNVNGCQPKSESQEGLFIPARDYGIPAGDIESKANGNHISLTREDSGSSGVHSMNSSPSPLETSTQDKDDHHYPLPPPPPSLPILEEEVPASFPPPPAPPPPPLVGSRDKPL